MAEDAVERGASGLEVRLEEELGHTALGKVPDVVADRVQRAPERPAVGAGRRVGDVKRPPADDRQRRGIAPASSAARRSRATTSRISANGMLPPV